MIMRFRFAILMALMALTSCFKDEWFSCELILRPQEQLESSGDFSPLGGVVLYAFDVSEDDLDDEIFAIESYEDALAGVVVNLETGARLSPIGQAVAYDEDIEEALILTAKQEEVMLVAIDTQNEWYAYASYTVGQNLAIAYIYLPFRPWKTSSFTQGDWTFIGPETDETDETDDSDDTDDTDNTTDEN